MQPKLQQLVNKGLLWQGKQSVIQQQDYLRSGSERLDQALGGGWQLSGLHEIQRQQPFTEQRLLTPLLHQSVQRQLPVFWINPPALVSAAGLYWKLSQSSCHIVVKAKGLEAAWAFEQILLSGTGLALLWLPQQDIEPTLVRRCYKAALSGGQAGFVLTGAAGGPEARAYTNRILINAGATHINIVKRRYGWPVSDVAL
ncbi:SulA-like SOS-response cell division inhibitor [Idiomarina seosinensis]|uniref:ImuA family protein n=1 Tax=Idiomarina seosinensis TaxID=281739 RepID=UPI00384D1B05